VDGAEAVEPRTIRGGGVVHEREARLVLEEDFDLLGIQMVAVCEQSEGLGLACGALSPGHERPPRPRALSRPLFGLLALPILAVVAVPGPHGLDVLPNLDVGGGGVEVEEQARAHGEVIDLYAAALRHPSAARH